MGEGLIGSFVNNLQLRRTPLSDLEWTYEWSSRAYVVRDVKTGYMLAYMTEKMPYGTVFTTQSLISNWIWRVSRDSATPPEGCEPDLEFLKQK